MNKTCTKCGVEKDITEFHFKHKDRTWRRPTCKSCDKSRNRIAYSKDKSKHYNRVVERKKRIMQMVNDIKSCNPCKICGETEPVCLDFHHVDPKLKHKSVSILVSDGSEKLLMEEVKKCVIICSNCHRKLHAGLITLKA